MEPSGTKPSTAPLPVTGSGAGLVEIVYYTDPLCCWSWAFEPHWRQLLQEYAGIVRWRYCMVGLIPSWNAYNDAVTSVSRPAQMGPVWMEAAQLTGVAINTRIWIQNPPASSYLPCIAVKCAEAQSAVTGDRFLWRLREAAMLHARNIALQSVLLQIAGEMAAEEPASLDVPLFSEALMNGSGLEAFRRDLQEVQYRGITRFPTLVFRRQGYPSLISTGYCRFGTLQEIMKKMEA